MSNCSLCDRPKYAKGLCSHHYHKLRKYGNPLATPPESINKVCSVCGEKGYVKQLCRPHYHKLRTYGDPCYVRPNKLYKAGEYLVIRINGKSQLLHRHIMEKHIGRQLSKKEHVHHINGNGKDNRIENLAIININEHTQLHHPIRYAECTIKGCNKKHFGRGLCHMHYNRVIRHGSPFIVIHKFKKSFPSEFLP